jgi:hypothetical protein
VTGSTTGAFFNVKCRPIGAEIVICSGERKRINPHRHCHFSLIRREQVLQIHAQMIAPTGGHSTFGSNLCQRRLHRS